jgi:hypothetical protein
MKKSIFICFLSLALVCIPWAAMAGKTVKVEILYMNHGPLQQTLQDLKKVFAEYGKKIDVVWHDIDTEDGEKFMAKKGINGHIPLVVWMDEKVKFQMEGKEVVFAGFPTGSGPASFQGKWTMEDVRKVLGQLTGK